MNTNAFRILLFGKDGRLGRELHHALADVGEVVALNAASRDFCGDLRDIRGISDTVLSLAPHVVVNAAAWTDVDGAEDKPGMVHAVNALAPAAMALAAQQVNAWFVHFSTDYVFDGSGRRPWSELDMPRPLNVYGQSKLAGERLVTERCARSLIFRTAWLYSAVGDNFATRILDLARKQNGFSVVDDQVGTPTDARWLAKMILLVVRRLLSDGHTNLSGIYHLVPAGHTSRYDYALYILKSALDAGFQGIGDLTLVRAISSNDTPAMVRRPLNARLDTSRFQTAFGVTFPAWQEGVRSLVGALR